MTKEADTKPRATSSLRQTLWEHLSLSPYDGVHMRATGPNGEEQIVLMLRSTAKPEHPIPDSWNGFDVVQKPYASAVAF